MNAAQHAIIFGLRVYRLVVSPAKLFLFGSLAQCRFTPSCSAFALEAVRRLGALRGTWLTLRRLGRCHPWGGCGYDPVPEVVCKVKHPNSKVWRTNRKETDRAGEPIRLVPHGS